MQPCALCNEPITRHSIRFDVCTDCYGDGDMGRHEVAERCPRCRQLFMPSNGVLVDWRTGAMVCKRCSNAD